MAGQFSNCAVVDNDISYNTGNAISLTSDVTGGTSLLPTNGPFNTVQNCQILGNQVNHNSHYGIIMAGGYKIEIGSNTTTYNGAGLALLSPESMARSARAATSTTIHPGIMRFTASTPEERFIPLFITMSSPIMVTGLLTTAMVSIAARAKA